MLGSSIKQAFGQSFKCCKKVKTREILQPTNSRMSNIESNDSQNGGLEDYIIILMESFDTLVPLYKDRLWVVKNTTEHSILLMSTGGGF